MCGGEMSSSITEKTVITFVRGHIGIGTELPNYHQTNCIMIFFNEPSKLKAGFGDDPDFGFAEELLWASGTHLDLHGCQMPLNWEAEYLFASCDMFVGVGKCGVMPVQSITHRAMPCSHSHAAGG